jgi:membrane protease YdiL (CAAX protease family)
MIRRLWQLFIAILALTVLAQFVIDVHPHFEVERPFGAYAIYGFAACAALILIARAIGLFLKRPDDYYRD